MSRKLDVTSFMIRNDAGEFDRDRTISSITDLVDTYMTLHHNDREKITEALLSVFAPNPKMTLNVPALQTLVMQKVWDQNPASYGPLAERIKEVLSGTDDSPGIREIVVERGPGKGARLRTASELAYFDANGRDMTKEEKDAAIDEARKASARK
jgi:hypothetical protein